MKEADIKKMILKGKWGKTIHLNQYNGLDKLQGPDVIVLSRLLKNEHAGTCDLALEDLQVSDDEALVLAELTEFLPLTDFSLQGSRLGDNCATVIYNGLMKRAETIEADHTRSWFNHLPTERAEATAHVGHHQLLKTFMFGALEATDTCLPLLAELVAAYPSLLRFNMRWSDKFTEKAAWDMASYIFEQNISLREIGCYGFFQGVSHGVAPYVTFFNKFITMTIKRNMELVKVPKSQAYTMYCRYTEDFNYLLEKMCVEVQRNYDLTQSFWTESYYSNVLTKEKFDALFDVEITKKQMAKDTSPIRGESEKETRLSLVPEFFVNKATHIQFRMAETKIIDDYFSIQTPAELIGQSRVEEVIPVEPKEEGNAPSDWQITRCQKPTDDHLVIQLTGSPVKSLKLAIPASGRMINLALDLTSDGVLKAVMTESNDKAVRY